MTRYAIRGREQLPKNSALLTAAPYPSSRAPPRLRTRGRRDRHYRADVPPFTADSGHARTRLPRNGRARRFAIIVIENDAEGRQGADAVAPRFLSASLPGMVIIAHERGNCCAYNAGWRTALEQFPDLRAIAVIDDDEIADPDWLENLWEATRKFDADIVGGPQVPVFAQPSHERWAEHPVFAPPYRASGAVPALYSSGNLLVTRPRARRDGAALPRPEVQLHGRRRLGFPQPGGPARLPAGLVRRGEGARSNARAPCRAATGSAPAACATA